MSSPFTILGISGDEIRFLKDDEIFRLAECRAKELRIKYRHNKDEKERVMGAFQSLRCRNILVHYKNNALREIKNASSKLLESGANIPNTTILVEDIFSRSKHIDSQIYYVRHAPLSCTEFYVDEKFILNVVDGGHYKTVENKRIVGCIPFGTRSHSLFEEFIKERCSHTEISFSTKMVGGNRITRQGKFEIVYDLENLKNIPLSAFPGGARYYIHDTFQEGAILLSLSNEMITPEGRIKSISVGR